MVEAGAAHRTSHPAQPVESLSYLLAELWKRIEEDPPPPRGVFGCGASTIAIPGV